MFDVFRKITSTQPERFVAPIPFGKVDLTITQNGIPFKFSIHSGGQHGWFNVVPIDRRSAQIESEASYSDIFEYLQSLVKFTVIAVCPVEDQTWLCLPFNAGDAVQRGWEGEPRLIHLVNQNIMPLDVLKVRKFGSSFLFEEVFFAPDDKREVLQHELEQGNDDVDVLGYPKAYRQPYRIVADRIKTERARLLAEQREAERKAILADANRKTLTLEEKIRAQLGFMGAELIDWSKVNRNGIKVKFSYRGGEWEIPLVDPNTLHVTTIGFCVSNMDRVHSLSSAVAVWDKARDLHRFDIPRNLWRNVTGSNGSVSNLADPNEDEREDDEDD